MSRGRYVYHALRVPDRVWLDRDLPLTGVSGGPSLSGPGVLRAQIDPEHPSQQTADGKPLMLEWGTLLIAERDGQIRDWGIVTDVTPTGPTLAIEATGFSALVNGQLYEGVRTWGGKTAGLTGNGVDPLDVIRHMWAWFQDQPNGDLGVAVSSAASSWRVGAWHNARQVLPDGELGPAKEIADPMEFDGPASQVKKPVAAKGKSVYWQYSLGWWDKVEIGRRMQEWARTVPFDYVETMRWADADKSDVVMELRFGLPRVGAKRSEPLFISGENLLDHTPVPRGRDEYANHVIGLGAGEGSKQLRASASIWDGRLRRGTIVEATDVTSGAVLKDRVQSRLHRARHTTDITRVVVADHPSAEVGSYTVGDDIYVRTGPEWGSEALWVRVVGMSTVHATGVTTLTCARSDSFDYSGRSA